MGELLERFNTLLERAKRRVGEEGTVTPHGFLRHLVTLGIRALEGE